MINVRLVAEYILRRFGGMPAMKLQKLVYYCQAWSLVWDDAPMFDARIEAWANGPVVPELYAAHRGFYGVEPGMFTKAQELEIPAQTRDTIERVVAFYGQHSSQWLSDLTHAEAPWRNARAGIPDGERGNEEITLESMSEYYSSL